MRLKIYKIVCRLIIIVFRWYIEHSPQFGVHIFRKINCYSLFPIWWWKNIIHDILTLMYSRRQRPKSDELVKYLKIFCILCKIIMMLIRGHHRAVLMGQFTHKTTTFDITSWNKFTSYQQFVELKVNSSLTIILLTTRFSKNCMKEQLFQHFFLLSPSPTFA